MLSHITIYRNRRCFKMYLISVYFDTTTTKRLQSLICQIAAVSGNTYMTQNHVPPHLTLSAVEARNVEVLLPPIQALEGKLSSGKVQFVSVGQLLRRLRIPKSVNITDLSHGCHISHLERPYLQKKCSAHLLLSKAIFQYLTDSLQKSALQR